MTKVHPPTEGLTEPSMNGQDPNTAKPDPFDPQSLCINAMTDIDVEQVLTVVPVRKPKRTEPATITRCPAST